MLRHRIPGLRPTATVLATALMLTGATVASAAPAESATPTEESAEPSAPSPALDDAQRLYNLGRAKFETADYVAAVDLWTEAYAILPDTADGNQIKVLLIYNIATAREKAFDVNQDPAELRQAKILLGNFEKKVTSLYGEGPEAEAERTKVLDRIAEIDERLAAYEREHAAQDEKNSTPTAAPPPQLPPDPEPKPDPTARGLIIGGAVAGGLGVVALGVMGAGLGMGARANDISSISPGDIDDRRLQFDRGRRGNALAFVGGVGGSVLLISGAVLLGIGLKRRNAGTTAHVAPTLGPGGAGLALRGRF